jgi:uncharacterized repeat protein (TIGR01451 family)
MRYSNSTSRTALNMCRSLPWRCARPCAVLLLAIGMAPVFAQGASEARPAVTVELTQTKVIQGADGKEQFVDAATVKPGDLLEYRATYTNRESTAINGVAANLPIPVGLEYQPKSAKPATLQVQAATQEGKFSAEPLVRRIANQTTPVPYEDYRTLRWNLGQLPAGGQTMVSARVKVQTYIAPTADAPIASGAALPNAPPPAVARASATFPAKP